MDRQSNIKGSMRKVQKHRLDCLKPYQENVQKKDKINLDLNKTHSGFCSLPTTTETSHEEIRSKAFSGSQPKQSEQKNISIIPKDGKANHTKKVKEKRTKTNKERLKPNTSAYEYDPTDKLAEEYCIRRLSPSDISLFEECLMKSELTDSYLIDIIKKRLKGEDFLENLVDTPHAEEWEDLQTSQDIPAWILRKLESGALSPDEFLGNFGKFMKQKLMKAYKKLKASRDSDKDSDSFFQSEGVENVLKDSDISFKFSMNEKSFSASSESLVKEHLDQMIEYPETLDKYGNRIETYSSPNPNDSIANVFERLENMTKRKQLTYQEKLSRVEKIADRKKKRVFHSIKLDKCTSHDFEEKLEELELKKQSRTACPLDFDEVIQEYSECGLKEALENKGEETKSGGDSIKSKENANIINDLYRRLDEHCKIDVERNSAEEGTHKSTFVPKRKTFPCDGRMSYKEVDFKKFLSFHSFLKEEEIVPLHSFEKDLHVLPMKSDEQRDFLNPVIDEMREVFLELDALRYGEDWDEHLSSVVSSYEEIHSPEKTVDDLEFDLEEYQGIEEMEEIEEEEQETSESRSNEDSATMDSADLKDVEDLFKKEDIDWLPYDYFNDPEFVIGKSDEGSSSSTSYGSVYSFSKDGSDDEFEHGGRVVYSSCETEGSTTTESDTTPHEGEESSTDPENEYIRKGIKYDPTVRKTFRDKIWKVDPEHALKAKKYVGDERDKLLSESEKEEEVATLPWMPYVGVGDTKEDENKKKKISIDPISLEEQYKNHLIAEMKKIYDTYDFYDTASRTVPLQVLKNIHELLQLKGEDALLASYAMKLCKTEDLEKVSEILGEDLKSYAPHILLVRNLLNSLHHPNFLFDDVSLKIPMLKKEGKLQKAPSEASLIPHVRKLEPDKRGWKRRMKLSLRLMKDDDLNDFKRKLEKLKVRYTKYANDEVINLLQGKNEWDMEGHWSKRRKYRNKLCFRKPKERDPEKEAHITAPKRGSLKPYIKRSIKESLDKISPWKEVIRTKKKTCNEYMFGRNYDKEKFSDHDEGRWSENDSEVSLTDALKSNILSSVFDVFPPEEARDFVSFLDFNHQEVKENDFNAKTNSEDESNGLLCLDGGTNFKHNNNGKYEMENKRQNYGKQRGSLRLDGDNEGLSRREINKNLLKAVGVLNNSKRKKFLRLYFPNDYLRLKEEEKLRKERATTEGDLRKSKTYHANYKSQEVSCERLPLVPFKMEKKGKIRRLSQVIGLEVKESDIIDYGTKINIPFGSTVPRGLDPIKKEKPKAKEPIIKTLGKKEVKDYVEENYPRSKEMENFFYKIMTLFDPDKALKYLRKKEGKDKNMLDVMLDLYTGLLSEKDKKEEFDKMLKKKMYKPTKYSDRKVSQKYYSWKTTGKTAVIPGTLVQIAEPQIQDLFEVEDAWAYSLPPLNYKKCGLNLKSLRIILGRMLREDIRAYEMQYLKMEDQYKKLRSEKEKCLFRTPAHYVLHGGRLTVPQEQMKVPAPWHYNIQRWPLLTHQDSSKKENRSSVSVKVCGSLLKKKAPLRIKIECDKRGSRYLGRGFIKRRATLSTKLSNKNIFCLFCTFPVDPKYYYMVENRVICYDCFHREHVPKEDYTEDRKLYNTKAVRPGFTKTKVPYISPLEAEAPIYDVHDFKWKRDLYINRFVNSFYFGGYIPDPTLCKASRKKNIYKSFVDFEVTKKENVENEIINYFHENQKANFKRPNKPGAKQMRKIQREIRSKINFRS